jgi:hypothetical protein
MSYLAFSVNGTPIQAPADIPTGGFTNGEFPHILQVVIVLLFMAAILFTLFMLIYGGYQWMTSGGDSKAIESARARIIHAIIGLILVFLAFTVVNVIAYVFDVTLIPGLSPNHGGQTACPQNGGNC